MEGKTTANYSVLNNVLSSYLANWQVTRTSVTTNVSMWLSEIQNTWVRWKRGHVPTLILQQQGWVILIRVSLRKYKLDALIM